MKKALHTWTQPPVQDPDTLSGLFNSDRNSPEVATAINEPFRIIPSPRRCEAVVAIVTGVHVQMVTRLIEMSVGMDFILDRVFNGTKLLFHIGGEAVQCRPGLV